MVDRPGPLLDARDLVRTYRLGDVELHALRGVSLSIQKGEMVAIMGASGSGKSTLLNLLGLLDRPTSGTYRLDGVETARLDPTEASRFRGERIGFVFQQFHLLPRTPAIDNVELPLLYRSGVRTRERRDRARAALGRVGLGGREQSRPTQLSGGQQQRVAIARGLVGDPAILLADEPTGNLDSRTGLEILALFQELHSEGRTIVMVTHEADVAACCRRIVVVRDGKIVSDRPVEKPVRAAEELARYPALEEPTVSEATHSETAA